MPLTPATDREPIHTRTVTCHGYRRADGLWDIEGRIVDQKTYGFDNRFIGRVEAGTPVHEMWIRMTLDDELTIREIEAVTDHAPFPTCPAITGNFQRLKGLSLTPGFNNRARELLGGIEGCTHLVDLLRPVATTAYQTIMPLRERTAPNGPGKPQSGRRSRLIDTCHGWASDGPAVKELCPEAYTGP